jgi:hypothetical protein
MLKTEDVLTLILSSRQLLNFGTIKTIIKIMKKLNYCLLWPFLGFGYSMQPRISLFRFPWN